MMTKTMQRRLSALEGVGQNNMSPVVKAWLGMELTDSEQRVVDTDCLIEPDWDQLDLSTISKEARDWLGLSGPS